MKRVFQQSLLLSIAVVFLYAATAQAADPLPSWNDGPTKTSIIKFVRDVTDKNSAVFAPPAERIATFDNDGTLWPSHPM